MQDLKKENKIFGARISFPVHYDQKQQTIYDSKGVVVCDIGEWERKQYMDTPEERLNATGEKVARLLNAQRENNNEGLDNKYMGARTNKSGNRIELFEWD